MKKQLLYKELAKYYDLIYSQKNYQKESGIIINLILKNKKSKGKELLDVGCGTGQHIHYFKKRFSCTGIDSNREILSIAKKKFPGCKFRQANMASFNMDKRFDVITCLFSSIGYVKTYENLRKTIGCFSKHLNKGGVVIIEPWFTKSKYRTGLPHMTVFDGKNIKIARTNVSEAKDNISILDMHYLIAETGKKVKYFVDRHELGMFDINKMLKIMKNNGLTPMYLKGLKDDRGLLIGTKN